MRGPERGALEPRAARTENFDHFLADDVDETAGPAAAGTDFGDAADAVHLTPAGFGDQLALPGAHHELADDEPHHEEDERRLDVVALVDRERVVRLGEEVVEGARRHDRGDETAAAAAE